MSSPEWTIPGLLQLSGGYWITCALHAGVKLDVFTVLDGAPQTAGDISVTCHVDSRATGMLLDALTALGFLSKQGAVYELTEFTAGNLSKKSPGYLGHIIMHHHHLMPGWAKLDEAVTLGGAIRGSASHGDDEVARESFLMGMFNLASQIAPKIAESVKLSDCHRLLDLGGGPGTYAAYFCQANPELTAVVYDLPTTQSFAEKTIARFDLGQRISFTSGDYHLDPVPDGFDAVWMSHVLHADGPAACTALLQKGTVALNSGGTLLVQEFILDDDRKGPVFPALFSLNMLLGTDSGQSYSQLELTSMMSQAGLSDIIRLPLDLPNGSGVMTGRKR